MNRFLKFVGIYVAFLVQSIILSNIRIISITPDLISIAIVLTAVYCSPVEACFIGAFGGILSDVICGKVFGVNTLVLMYLALLTAVFIDKKNSNSPIIMGWLMFVCIAFFQLVRSLLYYFAGHVVLVGYIGKSILVNGVFALIFTVVCVFIIVKKSAKVKEGAE